MLRSVPRVTLAKDELELFERAARLLADQALTDAERVKGNGSGSGLGAGGGT